MHLPDDTRDNHAEPRPSDAGVRSATRRFSRRDFLLVSVGASAGLLAACGPTAPGGPAPAATRAPTGVSQPTQAVSGGAIAPTSAAPAVAASKPGGKKIFRIGWTADVQNMDPAALSSTPDNQLGEALYNFLARYTYDPPMGSDIFPEVAERWDKSDDATTYTFYLRKGVKFHRGYGELTAEDVKANWVRIQNPETASRFRTDLVGATFDVLDPYTLRVRFDRPYPAFIEASAAYAPGLFLSPRALQDLGDQWKTAPVGSGPFQWGKSEPGSSLTLDRFEDYWGPRPKVDQIYNRLKVDTRAAVLAVSTGELDAVYIDDPDLALEVAKNPPPNTVFKQAQKGQAPYWLAFNLKRPPLDDVRVRHALRYAIDTESIAKDLFGGLANALGSFLPPFMWGFSEEVMRFPYDPNKAKQLLTEANVPRNWAPVMLGQGTSNNTRIIHEAVGSFWTAIGVQVKVDLPDGGVFAQRRAAGDYDMFGTGTGRIEPDQIATPYWRSGSTVNNAFYDGADELIDRARAEPDREKRARLYADMQAKVAQDSPAAFIISTSSHLLLNKRVSGVVGPSWLSRIDWFNVDVPAE